jgi:anti-sigma-K factor RskA
MEAAPSPMLKGRLLKTDRAEAASSYVSRTPTVPFWAWAGAAALALFSVYSAWNSWRLEKMAGEVAALLQRETQRNQELQDEFARAKREAIILTDPASTKIPMPGSREAIPAMSAYWHAQLGIVVTGTKVPLPAGKRTLQLWLVPKQPGAKPMSAGMIRPDANGNYLLLVESPPGTSGGTKLLAITEEPEGGSRQPTRTPKWAGGVN